MKRVLQFAGTVAFGLLLCCGVSYAAGKSSETNPETVQQNNTVTGTVRDSEGNPIIGAGVGVFGQAVGTVTDMNGHYSLNCPPDATLQFTCLGYNTVEIAIGGRSVVDAVLIENSEQLEELVVVGYGVQKKESLTGSVTAISSEDIETTKSENFINNLQGKMPGLLIRQKTGEPGTFDNMISIRGYGAPLVVIDGITRNGTEDLAQLSSEDIESVSILKDASAAIYGMNAANGVIIVTTKRGLNEKARIVYNNELGFKEPTGFERTADAYTYYVFQNEIDRNGGNPESYTQDFLDKYKNGEPGYQDFDWLRMYMRDIAFQQNHNISARGGSENVKYFASLGYSEDNGLLKSGIQYYHRYNFRTNLTARIAKHLTMDVNLSGRWTEQQQPREDFMWTYKTLLVNERGVGPYTIGTTDHYSYIEPEGKNAAALVDPDVDGYRRTRFLGLNSSAELRYEAPFVKGLTLSVLGSFDSFQRNFSETQRTHDQYDYYTDAYKNTFGSNYYRNDINIYQKIYGRAQANYSRTWESHTLTVTGVAEMTGTRRDFLRGSRNYTDIYTTDILDQGSSTTASNEGNRSYTRLAAYLGRLNYDYKGKYLLELVGRYDGSYRYAPSRRWTFFPSASAGWRISEEPWMKERVPSMNNLKLRASYGESGIDTGNAFEYIAGYTGSNGAGYIFDGSSLTIGMTAPGVVNDNLSWITSKIFNVGLDFEFWQGRFGGTVEVFQRKNDGILATSIQTVPNIFGASFPQENLNSNMNRGVELFIFHKNHISKDFFYTMSANFTYARERNLHIERGPFSSSWDRWRNGEEDRLTGRMWLYKWDGQYQSIEELESAPLSGGNQGNAKMLPGSYIIEDMNGDGIINGSDRSMVTWNRGTNPPVQYGFNVTLNYKNWDMSMVWQGAAGYRIQYRNNDIWGYGRYPTIYEKYKDRWHTVNATDDPFNPATQWVSGFYPALKSWNTPGTKDTIEIDVWFPSATYLRLKSLELGYSLPKVWMDAINITKARVYLNGFNLLTFCNKLLREADPEREERDWQAGLAYPLMRSYNIGVNITF